MADHDSRKPEQRALVPTLKAGSRPMGIVPQTFDDCFRLAQCASLSGTIPNGHDQTPEAITMVVLFGLELGIPPIQSMQGITKINGKFCIYGDLVPALLWSHGFDIEQTIEGEGDAMKAVCTITRPNGKKITRDFSVADAKVAGLWGANTWKKFPKRMLGWRALGFAKSDGASDIMRGMGIVEVERDIDAPTPLKPSVLAVPTDIPDGTEPSTATVTETVSEAEANQDGQLPNQNKYVENLADQLKEGTREEFDEAWLAHQELEPRLSAETQAAANALREEHIKRFETKATKKKPKEDSGNLL